VRCTAHGHFTAAFHSSARTAPSLSLSIRVPFELSVSVSVAQPVFLWAHAHTVYDITRNAWSATQPSLYSHRASQELSSHETRRMTTRS